MKNDSEKHWKKPLNMRKNLEKPNPNTQRATKAIGPPSNMN